MHDLRTYIKMLFFDFVTAMNLPTLSSRLQFCEKKSRKKFLKPFRTAANLYIKHSRIDNYIYLACILFDQIETERRYNHLCSANNSFPTMTVNCVFVTLSIDLLRCLYMLFPDLDIRQNKKNGEIQSLSDDKDTHTSLYAFCFTKFVGFAQKSNYLISNVMSITFFFQL